MRSQPAPVYQYGCWLIFSGAVNKRVAKLVDAKNWPFLLNENMISSIIGSTKDN